METKDWIKLDNASNIFLAARNRIDTKVYRMTVEMTEAIDPLILQDALNRTYEAYPLFQSVLRRGIFWYYLEKSEFNPRVQPETIPPVTEIYKSGEKNFMFRVLYNEKCIHLEVFHALTDGTGALWFFEDLITEYVRLGYVYEEIKSMNGSKREKADLEDSFKTYFKEKKKVTQFARFIRPFRELYQELKTEDHSSPNLSEIKKDKNIYQVKGTKTPDFRPRIILLQLPIKEILNLARAEGVSLTIYLTAIYILSTYLDKNSQEDTEDTTISVSIPINLRQFFPSETVRNFFSTTSVDYTFRANEEIDFHEICEVIDKQFKAQLEKQALENRLKQHIAFEFHPGARILPRPIKDLSLKIFNKLNNRKITLAMSNLGKFHLPDEVNEYVQDFYFYTSVIRPQFCVNSYKDHLNICFTSPFSETSIFSHFVQYFTERGVEVTVDSNKVTREELSVNESMSEL